MKPLLLLLLFLALSTTWAVECPADCLCDDDFFSMDCVSANLTTMPHATGSYKFIDVRHNNLTALLLTSDHSALEIVDASDNPIVTVSASALLPNIHRLLLHRTSITSIDRSLWVNLSGLQFLDLADNQISSVADESFADLEDLDTLDLSDNRLQELLPRALVGLSLLRYLNLEGNQLTSVPALEHTPSLISLSLRQNRLVTLPAFGFGRQIKVISVAYNQIKQIAPSAFQSEHSPIPQLTKLDLQHNRLPHVPTTALSCLRHLQVLELGGNLFDELPALSFDGAVFSRLHSIYLNDMPQLEVVREGAFTGLHSLRFLQMNSCSLLSSIEPNAISQCLNLLQMDLHACALTNISKDSVSNWSAVSSLDLRFNPLHCDCSLTWLKEHLSSFSASSPSPRCASPPSLLSRPLTEVPQSSLSCNGTQVDQFFEDRIMIGIFTGTCLLLLLVGGCLMYKYRHSMCEQTQPGVDVYSYFVYHNPNRMARHHNIPPRRLQAKPRDPNRIRHVTWSATDMAPYRPKEKQESQPPPPAQLLAATNEAPTPV